MIYLYDDYTVKMDLSFTAQRLLSQGVHRCTQVYTIQVKVHYLIVTRTDVTLEIPDSDIFNMSLILDSDIFNTLLVLVYLT